MGQLSRAADTLRALSKAGDSPSWDAALEHYRQTAVEYAFANFEADITSIVDELDVKSGDLRMFLVWFWRELDKAKQ